MNGAVYCAVATSSRHLIAKVRFGANNSRLMNPFVGLSQECDGRNHCVYASPERPAKGLRYPFPEFPTVRANLR